MSLTCMMSLAFEVPGRGEAGGEGDGVSFGHPKVPPTESKSQRIKVESLIGKRFKVFIQAI